MQRFCPPGLYLKAICSSRYWLIRDRLIFSGAYRNYVGNDIDAKK